MPPLLLRSFKKDDPVRDDASVLSAFKDVAPRYSPRNVPFDGIGEAICNHSKTHGTLDILHINCHGRWNVVEWGDDGDEYPVELLVTQLLDAVEDKRNVVVVLGVCYSDELARQLNEAGFGNIIYTEESLAVDQAGVFFQHFYAQLAVGMKWKDAMDSAVGYVQQTDPQFKLLTHVLINFAPMIDTPLNSGTANLPPGSAPSNVLVARYQIVPFLGRGDFLDDFTNWCMSTDRCVDARVIYGPGGAGKTRVMVELTQRLRKRGVLAGFVNKGTTVEKFEKMFDDDRRIVAVLDYAESWPNLSVLMRALVHKQRGGQLRFILLSRNVSDWLESLKTGDKDVGDLLTRARIMELPDFEMDPTEIFKGALASFSKKLEKPLQDWPLPSLADKIYKRILYVQMAALATLFGITNFTADDLQDEILNHEERFWGIQLREELGMIPDDQKDVYRTECRLLVVAITLRGGENSDTAVKALIKNMDFDVLPKSTYNLLHRLYPSQLRYVSALEPDVLGEALVFRALANEDAGRFLDKVFGDNSEDALKAALALLGRLSAEKVDAEQWIEYLLKKDVPGRAMMVFNAVLSMVHSSNDDTREKAPRNRLGLALAGCLETDGTVELARLIHMLTPEHTVSLREVALWAVKRLLADSRASLLDNDSSTVADLLRELGVRQSACGQYTAALMSSNEATEIYRILCKVHPGRYLSDLAACLVNLGSDQSTLRQHGEALKSLSEAVEIDRGLVTDPANLAKSLDSLGNIQADLDLLELALKSSQEAVGICRGLPKDRLDDLARSLHNLGNRHSKLCQYEAALTSIQEAVALYRHLAADNPDAFQPYLATSLATLGSAHSDLEQHEEALESSKEAVEIRRCLAKDRPDVFLADFTNSLANLCDDEIDIGQHDGTLVRMQEVTENFRSLDKDHPTVYRPNIAMSLHNLGLNQHNLGQPEAALKSMLEAVGLYQHLSEGCPDFFPELARSLGMLCKIHSDLGQNECALKSSQEAVNILRLLVNEDPSMFLLALAENLGDLSMKQSSLNQYGAAVVSTQAAVDIYRRLAEEHPDKPEFLSDLAESLKDLADMQAKHGQEEASLASMQEAEVVETSNTEYSGSQNYCTRPSKRVCLC